MFFIYPDYSFPSPNSSQFLPSHTDLSLIRKDQASNKEQQNITKQNKEKTKTITLKLCKANQQKERGKRRHKNGQITLNMPDLL